MGATADVWAVQNEVHDALQRETELISRSQQGDLDAFDELVATHQAAAQRVALMLGLSPDDAADAAQDAFVRAYRAIGRFKLGSPFRPWLAAIVANEARGLRRRAGRRLRLVEKMSAVPENHSDSPEADSIRAESSRVVIAAVQRLREHDQLPIIYRYFLDFSEAEMAAALAVPAGTVKSRLSRALARLRAELGERP
jgi:RNA polymerase sigma-70 factor (ECF subfamily)